MKKILLMVMVAVGFMACNGGGASVPQNDKKAAKAVTSQAIDLLSSNPATVDKALTDAGFMKVTAGGLLNVAKRQQAHMKKSFKASEDLEIIYLYNVPENYDSMTDEESAKYVKEVLDKGECIIYVVTYYSSTDSKLKMMSTQVMAPLKEDINLLMTEISDAEYKKLPTGSLVMGVPALRWEGVITNGDDEVTYENHAEFVSKIAKAQAVTAEEQGVGMTKLDMETGEASGFVYFNAWVNPDAAEKEEQIAKMGVAAAMGVFAVVDINELEEE